MNLSYSLNSINTHSLLNSCSEIIRNGYTGVELCFSKEQLDPFKLTDKDLIELKDQFDKLNINPVAISTATTFFMSDIPHEPSVISLDTNSRNDRVEVVKQGIRVARILGVPIVSFQSGYLRDSHINCDKNLVQELLINSIKDILSSLQLPDNINLVIEPEPGMYIETVENALNLINLVDDDRFGLHLDLCHTFCTEDDYLNTIDKVATECKYMHLADIKDGYNLKLSSVTSECDIKKTFTKNKDGHLFYIKNTDEFILSNNEGEIRLTEKNDLISNHIAVENKAYLDSVELISSDIKVKALPFLNHLRSSGIIRKPICNTIQGKVHYHEFPGKGEIDFKSVIKIINKKYNGYVTVELYNHANEWRKVLPESFKYLNVLINEVNIFNTPHLGEIDHKDVKAPYVRLATAIKGTNGDYGCMYDLRFRQPNNGSYIDPITMHSMEHALLHFFKNKYSDSFLCLAPMGCQTGFYLTLLNQTNRNNIELDFIEALKCIIEFDTVPYSSVQDCGQYSLHDLQKTQFLAKEILSRQNELNKVYNYSSFGVHIYQ